MPFHRRPWTARTPSSRGTRRAWPPRPLPRPHGTCPGPGIGDSRAGHTRPSPSPSPRPRTFFAAHDRGASARTRKDRSPRAGSAGEPRGCRRTPKSATRAGGEQHRVLVVVGRRRHRKRSLPAAGASEQPEPRSSLDHAHFRRGPPEPRRVRRFSSVHFRPRTLPACVPETRVPGAHPQPRAFPALTTKIERPPALWRRGAGRAWSLAG